MNIFYMVYNTEEGISSNGLVGIVYLTLESAEQEAERVAKMHPETASYVLQVVKACTTPQPTVKWEEVEKPKHYRMVLANYNGQFKIATIKAIRQVTNLGLKESKEIVDNLFNGRTPQVIDLPLVNQHVLSELTTLFNDVEADYVIQEEVSNNEWKVVYQNDPNLLPTCGQ